MRVRELQCLGIHLLELDQPAEALRAPARQLQHHRTKIDADDGTASWKIGEVLAISAGDVEDAPSGGRESALAQSSGSQNRFSEPGASGVLVHGTIMDVEPLISRDCVRCRSVH